jgi:hypothetical protein
LRQFEAVIEGPDMRVSYRNVEAVTIQEAYIQAKATLGWREILRGVNETDED